MGEKAARFDRHRRVPRPIRAWDMRDQISIGFWPERPGPRPALDPRPTSAKFAPDPRLGSAWAWTCGLAHLAGASIPLTLIGICRSMWYTFIGLRMFLQRRAQIVKNASIPIRQTNLAKS